MPARKRARGIVEQLPFFALCRENEGSAALPLALLFLPAGGLDLDLLARGLAVLAGVGDRDDGPVLADVAGVDQVAGLAAEDGQREVADRGVGDDRDGRLQAPAGGRRVGPRDQLDLAVEDEGQPRQAAGARDRVDRARRAAGRAAASSSSPCRSACGRRTRSRPALSPSRCCRGGAGRSRRRAAGSPRAI